MSGGEPRHLVFTLAAPYGAWGSASLSSATTAHKATELDPSKSALTGLLGAALGFARPRLGELAKHLRVAVWVLARPERDPAPDYHTITRADPPSGREHWGRFEELRSHLAGGEAKGSLISRREYWSGGLWTAAVWSDHPEAGPGRLAEALAAPRWPLYAGRKSCTLGLPPDPEVIAAAGPVAALRAYGRPEERHPALAPLLKRLTARTDGGGELLFDPDYPGAPPPNRHLRILRRLDRCDPLELAEGRVYPRYHERAEARMPFPPLEEPTP